MVYAVTSSQLLLFSTIPSSVLTNAEPVSYYPPRSFFGASPSEIRDHFYNRNYFFTKFCPKQKEGRGVLA
jgi:hypothetical protein